MDIHTTYLSIQFLYLNKYDNDHSIYTDVETDHKSGDIVLLGKYVYIQHHSSMSNEYDQTFCCSVSPFKHQDFKNQLKFLN